MSDVHYKLGDVVTIVPRPLSGYLIGFDFHQWGREGRVMRILEGGLAHVEHAGGMVVCYQDQHIQGGPASLYPAMYWSMSDHDDRLSESDMDQVLIDYLDDGGIKTGTVTLYGYRPAVVDVDVAELIRDHLHDAYGDPDEFAQGLSDEVAAHCAQLSRALKEHYKPWRCEVVKEVQVDLAKWFKENMLCDFCEQESGCVCPGPSETMEML